MPARWPNGDADDAEVTATRVRRTYEVTEGWEPVPDEPEAEGDRAMSMGDLLGKIEWEGGLAAGFDYGLKPEDLSADARAQYPEVAACWDALCAAYAPFDQLITRWGQLVEPLEDLMIGGEE